MAHDPAPSDHIGLALIRAGAAWQQRYARTMRDAGFPAAGEARGNVLTQLGTDGKLQSELPALCGMTKQAIAQHIEVLEQEGFIQRQPVPGDGRAKHVSLTPEGKKLFKAAAKAKAKIEKDLVSGLDGVSAEDLRGLLDWISGALKAD